MKCYIIYGPTASGKSSIALELAKQYNGCIINADSKQVLHEVPTLTARPTKEILNEIKHSLYGYINCNDEFSSFKWCIDAKNEISNAINLGLTPILVGGTGFYIKNFLRGHCQVPSVAEVTNISLNEMQEFLKSHDALYYCDPYRVQRDYNILFHTGQTMQWWEKQEKIKFIQDNIEYYYINIQIKKDDIIKNAQQRIDHMFPKVLHEVSEYTYHPKLEKIIGYKEVIDYLNGNSSLDECKYRMLTKTWQYAKRQKCFKITHINSKLYEINYFH